MFWQYHRTCCKRTQTHQPVCKQQANMKPSECLINSELKAHCKLGDSKLTIEIL